MSYKSEVIFTIGGVEASGKPSRGFAKGGDGDKTPSWAKVPPREWQCGSAVKPDVKPAVKPGDKGFAIHYGTGKSMEMRVVALTLSGCVLVTFFGIDAAAQHTRLKDITGLKSCAASTPKVPVLPPANETFVQGDKVWALETGKGWMRGKVIEVFGAHQSALVKFYHETGYPSQNTLFRNIAKEKPK